MIDKESLKVFLFGNQRQSESVNDAVVEYICHYTNLGTFDGKLSAEAISKMLSDKRFGTDEKYTNAVSLIFGPDNTKALQSEEFRNEHEIKYRREKSGKAQILIVPKQASKTAVIENRPSERDTESYNRTQVEKAEVGDLDAIIKELTPGVPQAYHDELGDNDVAKCLLIAEYVYS